MLRTILIYGWPKSGTTALFYTVREALDEPVHEAFERKGRLPAETLGRTLLGKELFPAVDEETYERKYRHRFEYRIWIQRDPRDWLISRFLYDAGTRPNERPGLGERAVEALKRKESDPRGTPTHKIFEDPCFAPTRVDLKSLLRRSQRSASFLQHRGQDFHVLRYEDFVAARLAAVEAYLGLPLRSHIEVPSHKARVIRSKASGTWRAWFTPSDVAYYRPALSSMLEDLHYDPNDWDIIADPELDPALGSEYVRRLIDGNLPVQA